MTPASLALRLAPVAFVLIWSTGWISAGYAAPYADPLTFLSVRFACAAALLALLSAAMGADWPRGWKSWMHALITGAFLHGIYLAGVWWAVRHGLPAGISGLIAALQPILTAAFSPMLVGERSLANASRTIHPVRPKSTKPLTNAANASMRPYP